jgi:hypothetical protein
VRPMEQQNIDPRSMTVLVVDDEHDWWMSFG